MASGVIKTEEWTRVYPISIVQGATIYTITFYKKGKTLKAFGFVQPTSTSHDVTITLNSDYSCIAQEFLVLRYDGWIAGKQMWTNGTAIGNNITVPHGDFTYARVDGILMLE